MTKALGASKPEFRVLKPEELEPWTEDLRLLERGITYPIADGDDRFYIDHGKTYHRFFSQMGKARFLVAFLQGRAVGFMAGAWKEIQTTDGRRRMALYAGDLKLDARLRGQGIVQRMLQYAIGRLTYDADSGGWFIGYAAAMRDATGDVRRSARGVHLLRLTGQIATLAIYFVPARILVDLPPGGPSAPTGTGLLLSQDPGPLVESTVGRKDLRLVSSGEHWPLYHLPRAPSRWSEGVGSYLREAATEILGKREDAIACFCVDERLESHGDWLEKHGLEVGARCSILALGWPWRVRHITGGTDWVHISTSEI